MSKNNDSKYQFLDYPYSKHLQVDVKAGQYLITSADGRQEKVTAENAKDAIDKSTLTAIKKVEYLGFHKKFVLEPGEVVERKIEDEKS